MPGLELLMTDKTSINGFVKHDSQRIAVWLSGTSNGNIFHCVGLWQNSIEGLMYYSGPRPLVP